MERRGEGSNKNSLSHSVTQSLSHLVTESPKYKTTNDIIKAVEMGTFPHKVMMTFHPQRWHNKPLPWLKELVWQNQPVGRQV